MVTHTVCWSLQAASDLEAIFRYIAEYSPDNARIFITEILNLTSTLAYFPEKFSREPFVSELERNIRYVPFAHYKIIYEISGQTVVILKIFSTRMNPEFAVKGL